jgi:predicted dienelactone hydrolase
MKKHINFSFHTFLTLALMIGLAACSDSSDRAPEPAPAPDIPGPLGVGHNAFTAIDPLRDNRMMAVEVWYPVDAEDRQDSPLTSYPLGPGIGLDSTTAADNLPVSERQNRVLLVFSHGYGGINTASVVLMETLASHGFIVISPEHTGNSQASSEDTFDQAAANRVPDVSFLIDTMINRSRDQGDIFYNRINENRVGVVGHSFGGMTSVGMAAGWAGAAPDPRVEAIVPISAVLTPNCRAMKEQGQMPVLPQNSLGASPCLQC